MATSSRKRIANRLNGQKSSGPSNSARTRLNATKHGLLSVGMTELDDPEQYKALLSEMIEKYKPVGVDEMFFVEAATLDMVRWRRARRLEGEFITSVLNPPTVQGGPLGDLNFFEPHVTDPGLPALVDSESAQKLVSIFQRYESNFSHRLFRTLHELERLQRMRSGEAVPAPAVIDVTVQSEAAVAESSAEAATIDVAESALAPVKNGVENTQFGGPSQ